jgi:hypothetical protein
MGARSMRPPLIVPLVLAGVIAALLPRTSEACMCMPATLSSLVGAASDVVAGRIVGVHRTGAHTAVRLEVERVWKGGATPGAVVTIALHNGFLGDHQIQGRIGQRWMVLADPYASLPGRREPRWRHKPTLSTGYCSGNWRITAKHPAPKTLTIDRPPPPSVPLLSSLPLAPSPSPVLP